MSLFFSMFLIFSGVTTVSNPDTEGKFSIEFQEDLRFGGGDDASDEFLWVDRAQTSIFEIGKNGHFFVIDSSNSQILEFDEKGAFVGPFAKKGEGPGEFMNVTTFQILENGTAIGIDGLGGTRKATYYDKDLKFIKTEAVGGLDRIPMGPYFSPDGSLFYSVIVRVKLIEGSAPENTFMTAIMNNKFDFEREFDGHVWPAFDQTRLNDKDFWAEFIGKQFDILINKITKGATFLSSGEVMLFDAKKYEIEMWSSDLKTHLKTIKKDSTPKLYTEDEKNALAESLEKTIYDQGLQNFVNEHVLKKAIENANLPIKQNPIVGIIPMEDGFFFVVNYVNQRDGSVLGEFFNKEGQFQGKLNMPGQGLFVLNTAMNASIRLTFKNGFAYAMTRNEEGDNQMVRYTYTIKPKK